MRKLWQPLVALTLLASLFLAACNPAAPTVEPTTPPAASPQNGAQAYPEPSGPQSAPAQSGGNYPAPESVAPAIVPDAAYPAMVGGLTLPIRLADGSEVRLLEDQIAKLTPVQVTAEGQAFEGYRLVDLLNAAGIQDFNNVILQGVGSELSLSKSQITDQVILSRVDGALKVIAPDSGIDPANWINGIQGITIQ